MYLKYTKLKQIIPLLVILTLFASSAEAKVEHTFVTTGAILAALSVMTFNSEKDGWDVSGSDGTSYSFTDRNSDSRLKVYWTNPLDSKWRKGMLFTGVGMLVTSFIMANSKSPIQVNPSLDGVSATYRMEW